MMKRGLVCMAWGAKALQSADGLIRSLWAHVPGMPVVVVGDAEAAAHFAVWRGVEARTIEVDPFDYGQRQGWKFLAGRVKPLLYDLSPFEETLYVDVDAEFIASPVRGFDLLARWDFVVAEARLHNLDRSPFLPCEREDTVLLMGTGEHIYHNSGLLFWRRCPEVAALMQLWAAEWKRYGDWDEQIALLRALMRSAVLFLTVPYTWNYDGRLTTLLRHAYGQHAARIESKPARRAPADEKTALPVRRPACRKPGVKQGVWKR